MAFPRFEENDDVYIFLQDYEEYLYRKEETRERAHVYFPYALKGQALQWYKAIARHIQPEEGETKYDVVARHLIQAFGNADVEEDEELWCEESTEKDDANENEKNVPVEENNEIAPVDEKEEVRSKPPRKRKLQEEKDDEPLFKRSRLEIELEDEVIAATPEKIELEEEVIEAPPEKIELEEEAIEAPPEKIELEGEAIKAPPERIEGKEESATSTEVEVHAEITKPQQVPPETVELKEKSAPEFKVPMEKPEPAKVKEKVPPAAEPASNRKGILEICRKVQIIEKLCLYKPRLKLQTPRSKQHELSRRWAAAIIVKGAKMESPPTRQTKSTEFKRRPPRQRLKKEIEQALIVQNKPSPKAKKRKSGDIQFSFF